jgi:hypothetical protein
VNLRVNVNRMLLESARGQDQQSAGASAAREAEPGKKPLELLRPPLPEGHGRHRRRQR